MLGQYLLGLREPSLLFDIFLHVATLVAVVAFYRETVVDAGRGFADGLRRVADGGTWRDALEPEGSRLLALVVVASIPTALLGVAVDTWLPVERGTRAAVVFVCAALAVNGCVLWVGRWASDGSEERSGPFVLWNISPSIALAVGTAQGIAVVPGFSRSGLTIVTALLLGVWRKRAARFSFLMSIPAILGALVLKFDPSILDAGAASSSLPVRYAAGFAAAAATGYAAILWLERLVARARFHHFSWYCWAVGGGGFLWLVAS